MNSSLVMQIVILVIFILTYGGVIALGVWLYRKFFRRK